MMLSYKKTVKELSLKRFKKFFKNDRRSWRSLSSKLIIAISSKTFFIAKCFNKSLLFNNDVVGSKAMMLQLMILA